jgi:hypothetical protein
MKRLAFALFLFSSFICSAAPHDDLINAIIESDYDNFMEIYSSNTFSQDSKAHFADLANQMIKARSQWMAAHAFRPQIGKDLLYAVLWGFLAVIGRDIILESMPTSNISTPNNLDSPIKVPDHFGVATGLGISLTSTVFCIWRIVNAFQKPKQLFANAVRIKDALAVTA